MLGWLPLGAEAPGPYTLGLEALGPELPRGPASAAKLQLLARLRLALQQQLLLLRLLLLRPLQLLLLAVAAEHHIRRGALEHLFGQRDGQHVAANKLTVIKALLSMKHDVDLSWAAKREVIGAIADNALASFVIINVAIKRSARLKKYAMRKDLNRRMPGFSIAMGFGLHVGWAIEGAIGSEYKIDASYLSPNVNMASRLEAATKQFGVALLLSEDFVECLSAEVREKVRQIDCVTVKGSTQPMGLFTYDICTDAIPEPTAQQVATDRPAWRQHAQRGQQREGAQAANGREAAARRRNQVPCSSMDAARPAVSRKACAQQQEA
ncbi:Adenylate cyclase [Tetrabaena socialis]|uniref:Adenylate cyclase n=1 Tax=Tetrabaena socialis TaxID=47790 RepID=A0A2J7ZS31_9CHLO|nr:Adenylate cyclase [Tetrabaena socialis]|eukprot:PNH03068.1 Adenylate cyclase [Tetrabaena socialis]